jgi:hypothetical protein
VDGSATSSPDAETSHASDRLVQVLDTVLERLAAQAAQLEQLTLSACGLATAMQRLEGRIAMAEDGIDDLASLFDRQLKRVAQRVDAGAAEVAHRAEQRLDTGVAEASRGAAEPRPTDPAVLEELSVLRASLRDGLLRVHAWLVEQDQLRSETVGRSEQALQSSFEGLARTVEDALTALRTDGRAVAVETRQAMSALLQLVEEQGRAPTTSISRRMTALHADVRSACEKWRKPPWR